MPEPAGFAPISACLAESHLQSIAGQNSPIGPRRFLPDADATIRQGLAQIRKYHCGKKKGGRSPLSVSPSRLISLTARCFFACGLDCAWGERTRPVKEWERANIPPHPIPGQHGHVGRVEKGHQVSLASFLRIRRGRLPWAASDPYAPGCRGVNPQLHPLVAPQVLHFMQVPLRTSV